MSRKIVANTLIETTHSGTRFSKNHVPREVVVIGAGLSKAFGLPLADELLPHIVKWQTSRDQGRLDIIYDFLEFFYPSFKRNVSELPPAEDVLGMLDVAYSYSDIRGNGRGYRWRKGKVDEARSRFNRLMGEYLWEFQHHFIDISKPSLEALISFVEAKGNDVIYITFNYDLLLETALSCCGIEYSYSLDRSNKRVVVLKPHGSINWFLLNGESPPLNHLKWLSLGKSIAVCQTLNPSLLKFRNGKWWEAALIAPTPNKQIQQEELKRVWTSFSSSVTGAPKITIVGYSLPSADRLARLVLNRAGPVHSRSKKIIVVNPDDVSSVFCQAISPKCEFINSKFEDWRDYA